MADVFDSLVGQDVAQSAMRAHTRNPVHAYLFTGPAGSSLHDALVVFAAALQCPNNGCGTCEACRLVLEGKDTDVYFAERSGVSWRVDELREADRVSRRRPLGGGYQIVVIEEVEFTTTGASPSAGALLKSLEEPPARTIFLLSAEELPEGLETIESRCVEVRLRSLDEDDLVAILVREGHDEQRARSAAVAANGNVRRASILVGDAQLGARIATWRTVPERLTGTPANSAALASEISSSLDQAMEPLARIQEEDLERRVRDAKEVGQRSLANRKDLEARFKREQRRFRIDELRFGLSALTDVYRGRLHESLENVREGDARSEYRVGASLAALDVLARTNERLSSTMDETLLLNDLMLSLMAL
jgi:DNA polymerase-3 subunit delta'